MNFSSIFLGQHGKTTTNPVFTILDCFESLHICSGRNRRLEVFGRDLCGSTGIQSIFASVILRGRWKRAHISAYIQLGNCRTLTLSGSIKNVLQILPFSILTLSHSGTLPNFAEKCNPDKILSLTISTPQNPSTSFMWLREVNRQILRSVSGALRNPMLRAITQEA